MNPNDNINFNDPQEVIALWDRALAPAPQLNPDGTRALNQVQRDALQFVRSIINNCPHSRERSLALTNAETAYFYACAAVTRNEKYQQRAN